MYIIFGATGNTGSVAAAKLLEQGNPVRVIGRSREKLAKLQKAGADVLVGDVEDAAFVRTALTGAKAAYLLIPPNYATDDFRSYQKRVTENLGAAAEATSLRNAVVLSSLGAEHAAGTGPIVGLHELEERLKKIPSMNVLSLRAGSFMHNLLAGLGLMKSQGVNGSPIPPSAPMSLVFPADIGAYAANRLAKLDFAGKSVVNLIGPRMVTPAEATEFMGAAVGKTFTYQQFPYEVAEKGMVQMGIKPDMAALYIELNQGAAKGLLGAQAGTQTEHLPTSFETFARQVFAPAFNAS
jgi:uncharacterized protein YbjT (DUF2867 family)